MQKKITTLFTEKIPLEVSVFVKANNPEEARQVVAMWLFQLISKTRGRDTMAMGLEDSDVLHLLTFAVDMDKNHVSNVSGFKKEELAEADRLESMTIWRWLPLKLQEILRSDPVLTESIQKAEVEAERREKAGADWILSPDGRTVTHKDFAEIKRRISMVQIAETDDAPTNPLTLHNENDTEK